MVMEESGKAAISSKLMWLGAAATMVGAAQGLDWISLLGSQKGGWIVSGLGLATMVLRIFTTKPIDGVVKS